MRPLTVRIIRELTDRHPPYGWTWIEGYELNPKGVALAKRELFVLREGVRWLVAAPPASGPSTARRGSARTARADR